MKLFFERVLTLKFFTYLIITFIVLFSTGILKGQTTEKKMIHPLMGSLTLSIEGGGAFEDTDYSNSYTNFIWRLSGEYFFNTFTNHLVGLKGFYGSGSISGYETANIPNNFFKTDLRFIGAGITYGYKISDKLLPTIVGALSMLNFDPKDRNGDELENNKAGLYTKSDVNLNAELGIRYFILDDFSLLGNFVINVNFNDWLEDVQRGQNNDLYYAAYLGLSYTINARTDSDKDGVADTEDLCPGTPENVNADKTGCPVDTDRDGVADYLDMCPDTPARIKVTLDGCPVDSDRDGVPDYLDKCPNTPFGIKVNRSGCAYDSDLDGVPDVLDKCPQTPQGIKVDNIGCPEDSDLDRVPDFMDKCPNTPGDILVDKDGCPLDSDADGVFDYLDKCPNTPLGTRITLDGCSDEFTEYIFSASTLFKQGEAILTVESYDELDKVIARIQLRLNSTWRIEGHTDENGTPEFNKVLSMQRAQAVFNYFLAAGLNAKSFEVVGLGEDFPIASNNTPEGRRLNRRVVLIRTE